uniref:Uncharacterized protein n=1 Tax=Anopheles coluzzii TaxID=1518534 RepID=A0A8W7PZC4_ANOCL
MACCAKDDDDSAGQRPGRIVTGAGSIVRRSVVSRRRTVVCSAGRSQAAVQMTPEMATHTAVVLSRAARVQSSRSGRVRLVRTGTVLAVVRVVRLVQPMIADGNVTGARNDRRADDRCTHDRCTHDRRAHDRRAHDRGVRNDRLRHDDGRRYLHRHGMRHGHRVGLRDGHGDVLRDRDRYRVRHDDRHRDRFLHDHRVRDGLVDRYRDGDGFLHKHRVRFRDGDRDVLLDRGRHDRFAVVRVEPVEGASRTAIPTVSTAIARTVRCTVTAKAAESGQRTTVTATVPVATVSTAVPIVPEARSIANANARTVAQAGARTPKLAPDPYPAPAENPTPPPYPWPKPNERCRFAVRLPSPCTLPVTSEDDAPALGSIDCCPGRWATSADCPSPPVSSPSIVPMQPRANTAKNI